MASHSSPPLRARTARRVLLALVACLGIAAPAGAGPLRPANDDVADASRIRALPFEDSQRLAFATAEGAEPDGCGYGAPRTVWYRYRPRADGAATAVASGPLLATPLVAVYAGPDPGALEPVACGAPARATFAARAGTIYWIQVSIYSAALRDVTVRVESASALAGTVLDDAGAPLGDTCVEVWNPGQYEDYYYWPLLSARTRSDGTWAAGIEPGRYIVRFGCEGGEYALEWYDDVSSSGDAREVEVGPGRLVDGIDASLSRSGTISGSVAGPDGPAAEVCVTAWTTPEGDAAWSALTREDGTYTLPVGRTGAYLVRFGCPYGVLVPEWYDDQPTPATADPIHVTAGSDTNDIDAVLARRSPPANDRLADATPVASLPFHDTVDASLAGREDDEPSTCNGFYWNATVWYAITPPAAGTVAVDTRGSEGYVELAVYRAAADGTYTEVACNRLNARGRELIGFPAQAGKTLMLQVGVARYGDEAATLDVDIDFAAGAEEFAFSGPVPCAAACPYWDQRAPSPDRNEQTCAADPPAPAGSWDDRVVEVPETVDGRAPSALVFLLEPGVDWDSWICAPESEEADEFVATGANPLGGPCVLACPEQVTIPVEPGETLVLRAYNWSDLPDAPASFAYLLSR